MKEDMQQMSKEYETAQTKGTFKTNLYIIIKLTLIHKKYR